MSSSQQMVFQIVEQHKEEYLELIIKQKTEALDRHIQKSQIYITISRNEHDLSR
jgi:hypothetical protein